MNPWRRIARRLALGAGVMDIRCMVLRAGAKLALTGAVIGALGAVGVARLIASSFPGMRLECPPVMFACIALLGAVAMLACWLPARRAERVDAMTVLRAE